MLAHQNQASFQEASTYEAEAPVSHESPTRAPAPEAPAQWIWPIEEIIPMIAMAVIVAVLVALLVLYVSECARITVQGYTQEDLRGELAKEYQAIEEVRAKLASRKQPERILSQAQDQGLVLVRLTQVQAIPVPESLLSRPSYPASEEPSGSAPGTEAPAASPRWPSLSPVPSALAAENPDR